MKRTGNAGIHVDAPPEGVFAVVVDVARLPVWNARVLEVRDRPARLAEGTEWGVTVEIWGRRFESRSHVIELDDAQRRFVYRSKPPGDDPSFSVWTWEVEPEGDGARVTLRWELRPVTFLRKHVISWLRHRQLLRTEAPASLAALAAVCRTTPSPVGGG